MAPRFVEPKTLIDELLAEQKSLTAVARFAEIHEQQAIPTQARYYRDLIPLSAPKAGQQYAFEVNLDQCSGCKACVTACHSLNGLDEDEVWRSVGLLHGQSIQKSVTTACHHCVDPGCLNGCPVLAYEKDPVTGIVKHLDDQCIGCSYCVLKCPYSVPKYSEARGIVRKCDLCSSRLAAGEAPACVQACPNEAIRITVVDQEEVSRNFAAATENTFLPDSPAPAYTRPTTKYLSAEPLLSNLRGADHAEIKPAKAHPSLVSFLVLTQMSAGIIALATLTNRMDRKTAIVALTIGLLGLVASVFHLGKPMKAWRAFLGLRRSWLSREIVAFGAFAPVAILLAVFPEQRWLALAASISGGISVFCSVMVYHDTHRAYWFWPRATIKFFGSGILIASAFLSLPGAALVTAFFKISLEISEAAGFWTSPELSRTSQLLAGPLRKLSIARGATLIVGLGLLAFAPVAAVLVLVFSELLERYLFFTAVAPDRMPGLPS